MLDLRTLDSILPEMVLLDLIVLELRALPETMPTWMQTGERGVPQFYPGTGRITEKQCD
jgi:hypothetical protein